LGEESDQEIPKSTKALKSGRKTNKNKREKEANQDEYLGSQTMLE
jgi:hypothetical protein